jgi:hypothetical protein
VKIVAATPKCKSGDSFKCHSFQLQQVKYEPNTCKLAANGQGEIEFTIAGRRPPGSTEEDCKLILIAGKGGSPLKEIQFSLDNAHPDFQNNPGYLEFSDTLDPSTSNGPESRKFLVQYIGTTKTRVTIHCKLRHGDSIDECENCADHQASIILELG